MQEETEEDEGGREKLISFLFLVFKLSFGHQLQVLARHHGLASLSLSRYSSTHNAVCLPSTRYARTGYLCMALVISWRRGTALLVVRRTFPPLCTPGPA